MTTIKHYCDKCAEQILQDRTLFALKAGSERLRRPQVDLCDGCAREFFGWLDARPAGCVAPTPRAGEITRAGVRTPSHAAVTVVATGH